MKHTVEVRGVIFPDPDLDMLSEESEVKVFYKGHSVRKAIECAESGQVGATAGLGAVSVWVRYATVLSSGRNLTEEWVKAMEDFI